MTLEIGSHLGPYEILGTLGVGGMGEVYRARDSRLERTVAIKVLPDHLSASDEIKQRFEREARVISSLSHPNICTLYDVGHDDGVDFLVMEHLEGETLAQRLEEGPLPLDQVLKMGVQIADALDKAHKGGVVHRDLKPGNVMLTADGLKLLDFGLAKLQTPESQAGGADFSRLLTETPASAPLTVEGTILGTFQYMAPEQIEGTEADARSDIFALGAVLYEMATGRKAFSGKTQASLIGSIMHSVPEPISRVAPLAPPALDRVVQTCLAKDPEERWHTAHDLKLQLQWIAEGGSQVGVPVPVSARRKARERTAWAAAAVATLAAAAFAYLWVQRAPEPPQVVRFEVGYPEGLPVIDSPKLSPDGRYLVFNATDAQGKSMLWLRPLAAVNALPMAGSEGAGRAFWSPDSRHLAFFAGGKLKKLPVAGGPPQTICDAPRGADGSWSERGVILYDGTGSDPIMRVAASGGVPTEQIVADPESGDAQVGWPQFLPGGERFLYVGLGGDEPTVKLASLASGEVVDLLPGQSRVEYSPPGHLLYVREGTLVAQPFDAGRGVITGEPVPMAEDLNMDNVGLAHFSASRSGALAFRGGEVGDVQLQLLDRSGELLETVGDPGDIGTPGLSPDGRWLAFDLVTAGGNGDIWIRDLVRGVSSRFTFGEGHESGPVWFPGGGRIAFNVVRDGQSDLAAQAVGGTGQVEYLLEAEGDQWLADVSPDGELVLYLQRGEETSWDLWIVPTDGSAEPRPVVQTPFIEVRGRFSPDGRWLAYQSFESGRSEIYVRAFPGPGGKWQISTAGGGEPIWEPDGSGLFYLSAENRLMRVATRLGPSFDAGIPEPMFDLSLRPSLASKHYLVSPDGERVLVVGTLQQESTPPTTIVLNWAAELGPR